MTLTANDVAKHLDALDIGFEPGADGALTITRAKGKSLSDAVRDALTLHKPELISIAVARSLDNDIARSLTLKDLQSVPGCELRVRDRKGDVDTVTPKQLANRSDKKVATLHVVLRDLELQLVCIQGSKS